MSGFTVHFHATREELVEKTLHWIRDYPIFAFAQRFNPFSAVLIKETDRDMLMDPASKISVIMFTAIQPVFPVESQFPEAYPDRLLLILPGFDPRAIDQITFGIKIDKGLQTIGDATLAIWKAIGADIKKNTKAGLRLFYPETQETSEPYKTFRYSIAAQNAFKDGARLLLPNANAVGVI